MKLPFEVNGVDLAALCSKRGYVSTRRPVYSRSVATMDGRTHQRLLRWQNGITVKLNDLTSEEAAAFAAAVSGEVLSVTYYNTQLGETRTDTMRIDTAGLQAPYLLTDRGTNWWSGRTVQFTEE